VLSRPGAEPALETDTFDLLVADPTDLLARFEAARPGG
jgi:hypothetical protein